MRYAYIGTVESLAKANDIAKRHSGVVISGVDHKGNYELALAIGANSERKVGMYQSALMRDKL